MALTVQKIEQLALSASLNLTREEKEVYIDELQMLLKYVEKIKEIDTGDTEPLIHILPIYNVFRSDEVIPSPGQEKMLSNAKTTEEGHYKVPSIM